jgi:hypothetical protein
MSLSAKQAVRLAKAWLEDQFSDEQIENLGLEEVRLNGDAWEITLGFSRAWEARDIPYSAITGITGVIKPRTYKVVVVDDNSEHVVQMRNREAA